MAGLLIVLIGGGLVIYLGLLAAEFVQKSGMRSFDSRRKMDRKIKALENDMHNLEMLARRHFTAWPEMATIILDEIQISKDKEIS